MKRILKGWLRLYFILRTVENAFVILSNRFRVVMTPICLSSEKVEVITLASCVLHNYLQSHNIAQGVYMPPHSIDIKVQLTNWRKEQSNGLQPLHQQVSNYSELLKQYVTLCASTFVQKVKFRCNTT